MYFEAKYYGPCPSIPTDDDSPTLPNVLDMMRERKEAGAQIRCHLYFSEKGVAVCDRKSGGRVVGWTTNNIASCATIKHPNSKTRRIGLLKIRDPATGSIVWHLFKYYFNHKTDNMSDCFRFIVDCSLRDIGRAYAMQQARRSSQVGSPPAQAAWPSIPPAYEATTETTSEPCMSSVKRSLFRQSESEKEEADLRASQHIFSGVGEPSPYEHECAAASPYEYTEDSGYMVLEPNYA